ncbi:MAG: IPTL-CTERM sorting domain-containing protein [Halioglobus sp.]
MTILFCLAHAGNSYGLATSCVDDDNWMNDLTSETYTYQQYADNPVQNIAGDSLALNMDALAVFSDGTVQAGDQIRFTLTNGATFAENPAFPGADPEFSLEEDLGGAGTGNLTVGSLDEVNPYGGSTLTFSLNAANFAGSPFSAPPDPCMTGVNYFSGEGVILSGSSIAGQSSNFEFAAEPWDQQDVTLQIDYLRGGARLFGGERVLFSVSDWVEPAVSPIPTLPFYGLVALGGLLGFFGMRKLKNK